MDEIMRVQKLFVEFMYKGRPEADGLPYKFPVVTANFKKIDIDDKEELGTDWFEYIARRNHKGFININTSPRFALCCRLNIDQFKFNSFGGGGLKLGSFRVVNINLPQISLKYSNDFFKRLDELIDYSIRLLHIEKKILQEKIQQGFLKFFNMKWFDLDRMFFGTLSFHGLPEAVTLFTKGTTTTKAGQTITKKIIGRFLQRADLELNMNINLEQAPSESATNTMARLNRDNVTYYSNQFVPLDLEIPLKKRIKIEGMFSDMLTGGSMCFLNLDSALDEEQSIFLHRYVYENSMINQWCPNFGWSVCPNGHNNIGDLKTCPDCGSNKLKHYERVVGYLVDRDVVNKGRKEEMENRIKHKISI